MLVKTLAAFALSGAVLAVPLDLVERDDWKEYTQDIQIHESCNATQRRMLEAALSDTYEVATVAKEYAITNGPDDSVFQQYFGTEPEAWSTVIGIWETFLHGNKEGVLLRCDNPDGNCANDGWAGHWRGENGSSETVICDLSYEKRLYNPSFCMFGFNLATVESPAVYWSIDLIHRMFHVPATTNELVQHYASDYPSVIELAERNSSYAAVDSDALQYYAAHVYATTVAQGGDACVAPPEGHDQDHDHDHEQEDHHDHGATPTSSGSVPLPPAESTGCVLHVDHYHCSGPAETAQAEEPSATTSAIKSCHTHSDGTEHCE